MSSPSGAILKFLLKWVVVPLALGTIGYFVIGPRIGATPIAKHLPPPKVVYETDSKGEPEPSQAVNTAYPLPQVELEAKRVGGRSALSRRNREDARRRAREKARAEAREKAKQSQEPSNPEPANGV